ncbi:MAG: PepSY domain-containing protein [Paracoccaceae bacterium]
MKKLYVVAALAFVAAPAFAEPSCNPGAELKPTWESIKTFEDEGGQVIAFKINDGGCYEIYGELNDTKMEVFFDPNTGEELERIES